MNKKQKLLSLFTALTLSVSAFSGFAVPAGAEEAQPATTELINMNFDDGTLTSTAAYGKAAGTPQFVTEDDKQCLKFDGTATTAMQLTKADDTSLLAGFDEVEVSFKIKTTSKDIASWWFYAAPNSNEQKYLNEKYIGAATLKADPNFSERFGFECYNNNSVTARAPQCEAQFSANEWYDVNVVYGKDGTVKATVNGTEYTQATGVNVAEMLGDAPVTYIGQANWGSGEYATGFMDDLVIKGTKYPEPTQDPTTDPSTDPSTSPSTDPSTSPSTSPSTDPSTSPSTEPSTEPTIDPMAVIDFTNRTLTATAKGSTTTFSVDDAKNAGATALDAAGAGNVLKLGSSQNGGGKFLGYTVPFVMQGEDVAVYSGKVNMSFKIEPMEARNDKAASVVLQFADIAKTPIFSIVVGTGNNPGFTIDGTAVPAAYGNYYVVEAEMDFPNKTANVVVKDSAGTKVGEKTGIALTAENLAYMYFKDKDWNYGHFALDDIKLDADSCGVPVKYDFTVSTERYAKMTTSTGKTYYADVNGTIVAALLDPGTTFDYTISKVGYTEVTGKLENIQEDKTVDAPLTKSDDYIFIESEFGNADEAYVSLDGSRGDNISIGNAELPKMAEIAVDFDFAGLNAEGGSQKTWVLKSGDNMIVGIQMVADGLYAWTGWTGSAGMNQSNDGGQYSQGVRLGDVPSGEFTVKFTLNTEDKAITVSYGDVSGSLTYDAAITSITGMETGLYRSNGGLKTKEIRITEPDPMYMSIIGVSGFAKISGKTLTRAYDKTQAVITQGETFEWTATRESQDTVVTKNGAMLTLTNAPESETTAKLIKLTYDEGNIIGIKSEDITIAAGQTTVEVAEETAGKKVMLWDSYEGMNPLAPAQMTGEYTVTVPGVTDMTGISIDKDTGVLTVEDTAVPGLVKVTCTGSTGKTASTDVMIYDFADVKVGTDGPNVYEVGQTGTYKVTSLVDEYGDDVFDMFVPTFSSEDETIVKIDAATGVAEALKNGSTNVVIKIGNPGKEQTITIPVVVNVFNAVADATGDSTEVSVADIMEDTIITGYQVTTATADGVLVNSTTVAKADVTDNKITVDTTGAAKVEVAPIYEGVINTKYLVPKAIYNVAATANNGRRADLYVNGQMLINNINQGSDNWVLRNEANEKIGGGRVVAETAVYEANDVCINEGYAEFKLYDDQSGNSLVTGVKFVRAPSIVNRAKRIYVIGDSLVAKYYGTPVEGYEKVVRTGWGDVLADYITDDVKVTNLGNSGAWAAGMYGDAFTNVKASAQEGDIVIWESGYNDRNHGGAEPMKEAMTKVAAECKELGVTLFFVTPNASSHDYKADVVLSGDVRTLAETTETNLIDLSKESYNFLNGMYSGVSDVHALLLKYYNNEGDNLHSSYNAANCWAAIVAAGLYANDETKAVVDTEHKYTFNDGIQDIEVTVEKFVTAEPAPAE